MSKFKLFIASFFFVSLVTSCEGERINESVEVQSKNHNGYFIESSEKVVVSKIFISKKGGNLIAEVDYFKNSFNKSKVYFKIVKSNNIAEITELSGLRRSIKISKNSKGNLSLAFFKNNSLIDPDKAEYTFIDFFEIIKYSNIIGKEVIVNTPQKMAHEFRKMEENDADGTFNSFAMRCSTASQGVQEQIDNVGAFATTSGIDCIGVFGDFGCWCSATVDLHGGGGSW